LAAVLVLNQEFDGTVRPWLAAVLFASHETGRAVFGCLPSGREPD
jgi:hypothetical protein